MSKWGDLENQILTLIERYMAGRYSERHGVVTAYDKKTYTAKVMFQPEGQESGWLPIETGHMGQGFGIAIGLTAGDGKSTGDQVIVRYQEGDFESGKIVQRVHSDSDHPPQVESGEMVFWHEKGGQIFFKKDGSLTIKDAKGSQVFFDGQGNVAWSLDKTYTEKAQDISNQAKDGFSVQSQTTSNSGLPTGWDTVGR